MVKSFFISIWKLSKDYSISSSVFSLLLAILLVSAYNYSFWNATFNIGLPLNLKTISFYISLFVFLIAVFNVIFQFVLFPFTRNFIVVLLLVIASVVSYFMNTYGVMFDRSMVQNTLETDFSEAVELLSINLFLYIVLLGVLPSFILTRITIKKNNLIKSLVQRLLSAFLSLAVIVIIVSVFYQDYASYFRNHRHVRYLINPSNIVYATVTYISRSMQLDNKKVEPIGLDAIRESKNSKPSLTIFVVGEAARASNFSLNGYSRSTTPNLSKLGIINFSQMSSCGTSTAVSVPCMFSHLPRNKFSQSKAKQYENVIDILQRVDVSVLWRENNSGCKGVCDRVPTEVFSNSNTSSWCETGECFDEVLLENLLEKTRNVKNDMFIVLHQKGSHGPAYYKRYPKDYKHFTPICSTNQLQLCSRQEIINAYDNTIAYTDHFLSETILFLKKQSENYNTSMIYVSDHGESLGENNMYLHGTPYFIAPKEQTHVPFFMWFSKGYLSNIGMDEECVVKKSEYQISQDNIFHSLLGLYDVDSKIYESDLDIFHTCKTK